MHGLLPYIPPPDRRSCGATVEYLSLFYLSISPLDDGLGGWRVSRTHNCFRAPLAEELGDSSLGRR
jgi:hypothetical protein